MMKKLRLPIFAAMSASGITVCNNMNDFPQLASEHPNVVDEMSYMESQFALNCGDYISGDRIQDDDPTPYDLIEITNNRRALIHELRLDGEGCVDNSEWNCYFDSSLPDDQLGADFNTVANCDLIHRMVYDVYH